MLGRLCLSVGSGLCCGEPCAATSWFACAPSVDRRFAGLSTAAAKFAGCVCRVDSIVERMDRPADCRFRCRSSDEVRRAQHPGSGGTRGRLCAAEGQAWLSNRCGNALGHHEYGALLVVLRPAHPRLIQRPVSSERLDG